MLSLRSPALTNAASRTAMVVCASTPLLAPTLFARFDGPDGAGIASAAVRSHRYDCSTPKVTVAPTRSGEPMWVTALARMVPRVADPEAAFSAVSATEGTGPWSFETFDRR